MGIAFKFLSYMHSPTLSLSYNAMEISEAQINENTQIIYLQLSKYGTLLQGAACSSRPPRPEITTQKLY